MGLFKIFGGGEKGKKNVSAKEALTLARTEVAENDPENAKSAKVCCVYTACLDADADIEVDGKCIACGILIFIHPHQISCIS